VIGGAEDLTNDVQSTQYCTSVFGSVRLAPHCDFGPMCVKHASTISPVPRETPCNNTGIRRRIMKASDHIVIQVHVAPNEVRWSAKIQQGLNREAKDECGVSWTHAGIGE